MHNKFCIIDEKLVLTGSYNWTYYAENLNWENLLEIDDDGLVKQYLEEFERIINNLKPEATYVSIGIRNLKTSELHDNYNYLCNDLSLKDKFTKALIERLNTESLRDVKLEGIVKAQEYDKSGRIPLLKKVCNPTSKKKRLVNIHIGTVPPLMPNSGEKYVHAQRTSNDIWKEDTWVYIIDKEYVEEMRKYFHKCDGGILDNAAPLPPIPANLYTPEIKYKFVLEICYFKDDKVHHIYDSSGQLLSRYEYKMFNLYARIGAHNRDYIGYKSLMEQYQWIVKSLFSPNDIEDIDYLKSLRSTRAYPNGIYRGSIDDYSWFYAFEQKRMKNGIVSQKSFDQILQYMKDNPNMFWFYWQNGLMTYVYGRYITHKDLQLDDFDIPIKRDGFKGHNHWLFLETIVQSNAIKEDCKVDYKVLYEKLLKDIKSDNTSDNTSDNIFEIITIARKDENDDSLWNALLSLGFMPESQIRFHYTIAPYIKDPGTLKDVYQLRLKLK